ncbi:choice-of-anchor L domain-containing protein, partial [Flavobacterium subsaxonicum]
MKKTTLIFFMFFISLCSYAQLALEGFEGTWTEQTTTGAGGPTGWALANIGNGSQVWWVQGDGSAQQPALNGTHAAFLDKENVTTNTFSEDWLITKSFPLPANPQLHFYSKLFFNADQSTQFKIYICKTTANAQTNTTGYGAPIVEWTELQLNPVQLAWTEKKVDLTVPSTIATGDMVYLAFVMKGDNAERWAIDDVSVTAKCFDPTTLTSDNETLTTAELSWANPSGATTWEIEVLEAEPAPTGSGQEYSGTLPFVAGTPGYDFQLEEDTDYKYYVRALCGDGGVSDWVGPFFFSTVGLGDSCSAPVVIPALPYSVSDNTSGYADTNYEGSPGATGCGVNYGYMDGNNVVYAYEAEFTGVISLDLTNNSAYSGMFVYDSCADIGVECIGGGISSWTPTPISIPTLSVTAGTTYYIVISTSPSPQTTPFTLTIQQVNCEKPVGLLTTNIGMTSADLSWTNPSGATSWQLYVQTPNAGIPAGAGTTVTDNTEFTVTQTNLGANLVTASPYEYYVRADCGNGTFSAWAGPYAFNTMICEAADQCTYTFVLTDSFGDGWNGNTMTVSQNGITIATLSLTSGYGTSVPVQVCNGVPLQLFWNSGGSWSTEVGVSIQNSFAQTFYTKAAGVGAPNSVLYTGDVDCDTPMCLAPTGLTATNITNTSADLGWAGQPTGDWEYYVVEAGGAAPTDADAIPTSTNPVTVAIEEATNYVFYVRMVCSDTQNSPWAGPYAFSSDSCPAEEQCDYTFIMTSSWGAGWYGAQMQISQNGINVATIGSTFTTGATQAVTVPLCTGLPFQVQWTNGGNYSYIVGLQIVNGFDQTLFTMLPYEGTVGTAIYTGAADCLVPACLPPTGLYTENATMTTIDLGWDGPATADYEYYIVNVDENEAAPTDASTPTGSSATNPAVGVGGLTAATNYEYYVRIVCDEDTSSSWAGPFPFHTTVCEAADQCLYTFTMQSQNGWGYEGNTMTVYQAGVPVATFGDEFTWGVPDMYEHSVQIPLCADTEISIYWNTGGWDVSDKGLIVYSPFMEDIFVKPFGTGAQGSTIFTGIPSCEAPLCPKPQNLTIENIELTTAEFGWDEMGAATQWEVTVVAYQADAPDPDAAVVTTMLTNDNPVDLADFVTLTPGTTYSAYVRAICGGDNGNSTWSGPETFTTAVANDDCDGALPLPVNPGADCVENVSGTVTGATSSGVTPSCMWGEPMYDVWYSFVATGPSHAVEISNAVGGYYYLNISTGGCGDDAEEVYCGYNQSVVLDDLEPGETYYVMVHTTYIYGALTSFDLCVTTPEPPITVSSTEYTNEELVQEVFLGSDCALVSNVISSTGTTQNGIGYFEANGSSFPFATGIVLVSGDAEDDVPGPNSYVVSSTWENAAVETMLENEIGVAAGSCHGGTSLQFDFSPLVDLPVNHELFRFIFASEEYNNSSFECTYSDVFAFILTDLETNETYNLAVIPGTTTPILVTTIHEANASCTAANAQYFGQHNSLLAPINFNGQTTDMSAYLPIELLEGHNYRMQMAVANQLDSAYSSAVFLLGGSLDIGSIPLGDDMTVDTNNAICDQGDVTLNSNLDPEVYTFQWLQDGVVMDGETDPTLLVTEPGQYTLQASVIGADCVREGNITIEFYEPVAVITQDPVDLTICDADGYATFDLTENTPIVLTGLDASIYTVTYYLTQADAEAQTNAIDPATAFTNTTQYNQTIYVRIILTSGQCYAIKSFELNVQDFTPVFTPIPADVTLCGGASGTIGVNVTNPQPGITYTWTLDGVDLTDTTSSITVTDAGVYVVTIDNGGCTATATVTVTTVAAPTATIAYAGPFCSNGAPAAVTLTGSTGGVYSAAPIAGETGTLVIDATTGTITMAGSTPGTYIVTYSIAQSGSCDAFTTTTQVVINEAPEATIEYTSSVFCSNAGVVIPGIIGTGGGTFTASNGLAIDPATGAIDTATEGTYTITYTIAASGACAEVVATFEVTISAQAVATITYGTAPYCSDAGNATVTQTGVPGGVYSAPTGVVIDPATGQIDLAASAAGTFEVTYTVAATGGCDPVVATTSVTITTLPTAGFTYASATVCQNATNTSVVLNTGATAGVFTVDNAGLIIDAATGAINPATSQVGTYVVTNTIAAAGGCAEVTATFTVNVIAAPVPTFTYASVAYCQDEATNPSPILTDAAGTFSASPAGLSINAATGVIDLAASTAGTYTVSNTVAGTADCPSVTATTTITITALPVVTVVHECINNEYTLSVSFENDLVNNPDTVSYSWNSGSVELGTDETLVIRDGGTYSVTVTPLSGDCPATAEIVVESASCMVQKGISPNNDGLNDSFDLSGLDVRKLEIFNRYGKEVYSKSGYKNEWFGQTDGGDELPT